MLKALGKIHGLKRLAKKEQTRRSITRGRAYPVGQPRAQKHSMGNDEELE